MNILTNVLLYIDSNGHDKQQDEDKKTKLKGIKLYFVIK